MRCLSCNWILSDFEATRKAAFSGEFVDLCNRCYDTIREDLLTIERTDLSVDEDDYDETSHCGLDFDKDY